MKNQNNEAFKKTFTVNGETEEKLVRLYEFVEYDERGKEIFHGYYNGMRYHPDDPAIFFEEDAEDKRIYHKYDGDGIEIRREYDANGNEIHCKKSNGYEHWYEYDERGNRVQGKIAMNGLVQKTEWYDCDERGNVIHWKQIDLNSNVYEEWLEYDKNGKCTSLRDSDRVKERYEYDERGNKTLYWYWLGKLDHHYEYDAKGRLVLEKRRNRVVRQYEYDENGRCVLCRKTSGDKEEFKYDEHGRLTYRKNDVGVDCFSVEEWRDYDEAGCEVRRKYHTKFGEETRWYEYEHHENGELKTLTIYRHHEELKKTGSNSQQSVTKLENNSDELEESLGQ